MEKNQWQKNIAHARKAYIKYIREQGGLPTLTLEDWQRIEHTTAVLEEMLIEYLLKRRETIKGQPCPKSQQNKYMPSKGPITT